MRIRARRLRIRNCRRDWPRRCRGRILEAAGRVEREVREVRVVVGREVRVVEVDKVGADRVDRAVEVEDLVEEVEVVLAAVVLVE